MAEERLGDGGIDGIFEAGRRRFSQVCLSDWRLIVRWYLLVNKKGTK